MAGYKDLGIQCHRVRGQPCVACHESMNLENCEVGMDEREDVKK